MARITILGSGTCQLELARTSSSVLIDIQGRKIVFDFGRGTCQRLVEQKITQNNLSHILLSHFHPDHLSDLIPWLHAASWSRTDPRTTPLYLYGPKGMKEQMDRLFNLFPGGDITRSTFEIHVHELTGDSYQIDGLKFTAHHLPPAGNTGVIITDNGKSIGLAGDSDCHQALIDFSRNLDFVVLDAGHSSHEQTIAVLAASQPKTAVLSHLYSNINQQEFAKRAKDAGFQGTVIVAHDGMSFEL